MLEPAEGIRPPGETAWLAYGSVFGSKVPDWNDLDIADKLRWAMLESSIVENYLAQSNPKPFKSSAGRP